jgi:hypothetical protein
MRKRVLARPLAWLISMCTAAAMMSTVLLAAPGGAATAPQKEYTTHFEAECVLAPGFLNEKGTIKVTTRGMGPERVAPGEEFQVTGSTITVVTPKSWGEQLHTLGATEARGFVLSTILDATGATPARLNVAKPPEFPEGLPFRTKVEPKEVEFTVPSNGRTFSVGPYKVTGNVGESVKLAVDTAPGFRETAPGRYESTGEGIQSETNGYNERGERVIGNIVASCTAPAGVVEGEVPIVTPETTTTTSTTTTSTTSESSTASTTSTTAMASTTAATTTTSTTSEPTTTTTSTATGPEIERLEPNFGPLGGGTPVRIVGRHLSPVEERCTAVNIANCHITVHFGSKQATVLADAPTNALVESPPASAPGAVDVTVTVNGVTSAITSADRFTYKTLIEELEEHARSIERAEYNNWPLSGQTTDKKQKQPIKIPEGATFSGSGALDAETGAGAVSGNVSIPPLATTIKLFGVVPVTLSTSLTQVGPFEGKVTKSESVPGDETLTIPAKLKLGVSALSAFGLKLSLSCMAAEPLSLDLVETLTREELLRTGWSFSGTTTLPSLTCEGPLFGHLLGTVLNSLLSGPENPFSLDVKG